MLVALVLVLALAGGCGRERVRGSPPQYQVQSGDTLYSIAWRFNIPLDKLAGWNKIGPPYTIFAGQRLDLGPPGVPVAEASRSPRAGAEVSADAKTSTGAMVPVPEAIEPPVDWHWPTEGSVAKRFNEVDGSKAGIEIRGNPGQPVLAAAPGKVVYSGNSLKGYGELIIIKHNDAYLSAYAYNRIRIAQEGEQVAVGQPIAELGGRSENQQPVLHFEIRQYGRPVDPLLHLPAR
ncbi:MAG: peptidoglycan DD-metalloendopeptidase family protein [Thiotrichales bacterium]